MSLTKDTLLKLKIVKTLIDAKNIETHYTLTRLMIVTVNLEFINKTCCLLKLFLKFSQQHFFFKEIIPTLFKYCPFKSFFLLQFAHLKDINQQ